MRIILAVFATTVGFIAPALAGPDTPPGTLSGTWLTGDADSKVRIAQCGTAFCASIVWVKPRAPGEENPHPALEGRDMVGTQLSSDLRRNPKGELAGSILNPENGKTYQVTVRLKEANALELEGCILGGIFCGSETWTRAAEDLAAVAPKTTGSTKSGSGKSSASSATRAASAAAAGTTAPAD